MDDDTFTSTWDIDTDPAEIVGTGPFTIERYEPGERVVMRRNPDYWLEDDTGNSLPYLDEIVHVIVPDLEAELANVPGGRVGHPRSSGRRVRTTRAICRKKETSRYTGEVPRLVRRSSYST